MTQFFMQIKTPSSRNLTRKKVVSNINYFKSGPHNDMNNNCHMARVAFCSVVTTRDDYCYLG